MLIYEEYFKRKNIDIEIFKYEKNSVLFFEYLNIKCIMVIKWHPPQYHPGHFTFQFQRIDGMQIKSDFTSAFGFDNFIKYDCSYETDKDKGCNKVHFDQYQDALTEILSTLRCVTPKNYHEVQLFVCEALIKAVDPIAENVIPIQSRKKWLDMIYRTLDTSVNISHRSTEAEGLMSLFVNNDYVNDLRKRLQNMSAQHSNWLSELNNKKLVLK